MKRRIVVVVRLPEQPVRRDLCMLHVIQRPDCHRKPQVAGVRLAFLHNGTREPLRRTHCERPTVEVERQVIYCCGALRHRSVESWQNRAQVRIEQLAMACAHCPEHLFDPRATHAQLGVRREEGRVLEACGDREGRSGEQHVDAIVLALEVERVAVPTTHVRVAGNGGAGGEGGGREGGRGGGGGQTYVDHPEYGQLLFDDKDEWMRNLLQSLSAEAESNIPYMLVTLLVSQLSGLLKLLAP
eukprot:CAMPEP_0113240262 /NCGR_PEP_ID=MMETSP0008_2-20120614/6168_1 /TAXON_ID=97485 /ORGANISM="Prymnesium parvum" /LENGTH=241 /DNA_ID=CAMNT_0000087589 /DNA_START=178 /DNA_END=904 /DNA_ORIENTATION=- /assembly_acc=CAM_ASM_000153